MNKSTFTFAGLTFVAIQLAVYSPIEIYEVFACGVEIFQGYAGMVDGVSDQALCLAAHSALNPIREDRSQYHRDMLNQRQARLDARFPTKWS